MSTMNPHKDSAKQNHWGRYINDRMHEAMAAGYYSKIDSNGYARRMFMTPPSYKTKKEKSA